MKTKYPNVNIAIIHAEADKAFIPIFKNHLRPLVRVVNTFTDVLLPGDQIQIKRKTLIEKADIILVLLSSDFIAELYQRDDGYLKEALAKANKQSRKVIPIILRACTWEDVKLGIILGEQSVLPRDKKPLLSFDSSERDRVITEMVVEIGKRIKEIDDLFVDIVIPTFSGYLPGISINQGFEINHRLKEILKIKVKQFAEQESDEKLGEESDKLKQEPFPITDHKEFVRFHLENDPELVKQKWAEDIFNIVWTTLDQLPTMVDVDDYKDIMILHLVAGSNGADVLIAKTIKGRTSNNTHPKTNNVDRKSTKNLSLNSFSDLIEKDENQHIVIVATKNAPSMTFLFRILFEYGVSKMKEKVENYSLSEEQTSQWFKEIMLEFISAEKIDDFVKDPSRRRMSGREKKITIIEAINPDQALKLYQENKNVDAIVTCELFSKACLGRIDGSKIIVKSSYSSDKKVEENNSAYKETFQRLDYFIGDILIAKKAYIETHKPFLIDFFCAWLAEVKCINERIDAMKANDQPTATAHVDSLILRDTGILNVNMNDSFNYFANGIINKFEFALPKHLEDNLRIGIREFFARSLIWDNDIRLCSAEDNYVFARIATKEEDTFIKKEGEFYFDDYIKMFHFFKDVEGYTFPYPLHSKKEIKLDILDFSFMQEIYKKYYKEQTPK